MNRSLKEATVRRYRYDTHRQLEDRLAAFLNAYNFAKRLKTLRGMTLRIDLRGVGRRARSLRCDPAHLTRD